jgi:CRISPR-associated protein Csb1
MSDITQFDYLLSDEGPAALVVRENLAPVEGKDGVVFPSTFAPTDSAKDGSYNIDDHGNGTNVCLIDSVGSQANRIEPLFKEEAYKHLVPQVVVKAGEKEISILEAGHRAGDALVRCSALDIQLNAAFKAVLGGDCEPLARIAPTSLVFGVWDSRDTQAKLPRLVSSTIRAYNVRKITRSAQYVPAARYIDEKLLDDPADKKTKDLYSQRGFLDVPSTGKPGGVIADGGIRRDATLALAALRLLKTKDAEKTLALRRYILGLALTSFTFQTGAYLRQGCMLVLDAENGRSYDEVYPNGTRKSCQITHAQALAYATETAKAFGVASVTPVFFDPQQAKKDLDKAKKNKKAE